MTFNTGNNVPSTDPRDLYDNAENLDKLVNGADPFYADRLGKLRESWAGMENSFGNAQEGRETAFELSQADKESRFQAFLVSSGYVRKGDYAANVVLEERNEYVAVDAATTGTSPGLYRPSASATLPLTLTGTWATDSANLVLLGDDVLRQELAESGGVLMVGNSMPVVQGLDELAASSWLVDGATVLVDLGDLGRHIRLVSGSDDGTGIAVGNGLFANLVTTDGVLRMSALGVVGGQDYTTLINSDLPSYIVANDVSEIVLDTGNITVLGVLDFAYSNVVFSGEGKLLAADTRNTIQKTQTSKSDVKQFNGPINSGHVFCSVFKTAALIKKEVRVVLLGDSISVGGDYDSHDSIPPGSFPTLGVDNKDRHTSFSAQLYAQIVAAVPSSTRVKFYNRSIAGLGYGSIASAWDSISGPFAGREQATAGKSWRDCVLDLRPDLVIHALGMNETPDSYANGFSDLWHKYLQDNQLIGTFDQAIVTTPNPNFQDATPYGDFRNYDNNAAKFYIANLQRYFARLVRASLIDVSALSFIKRYGFDPRHCVFSNEEEHCVFSGTGGYSGEVAGTPITIQIANDSFYKTVRLRLNSSVDSSTTNYDFRITLGSVLVNIIPDFLRVYPKGPSSSNTLIGAPSTVKPFSLSAGVPKDIAITISPTGVFVYSGSNLVASSNKPVYSSTLGLELQMVNATGVMTVDEVYLSNGLHPRYTADTKTHNEMYGFVDWTANKFGGGINHPSSVGITEVYTPPVAEWANSVINHTTEYSNVLNGTNANQIVQVGRVARVDGNEVSLNVGGIHLFKMRVNSGSPDGFQVQSNPSGTGISILVDPDDLTVFFKNTTIAVYTVNHTGAWLTKEVIKLGAASVRGGITPLPTV